MTVRSQGEDAAARDTTRPATTWVRSLRAALLWAALGAALIVTLSQIPARHAVDVGGWDAAYVQGFHEPEPLDAPAGALGRWSRASSALLFPQAGLPGEVTLVVRGPAGAPAELRLLLNGEHELARGSVGTAWTTFTVPIAGGRLKATDFFVELRATTTRLPDEREVGVLVDRATYTAGPGLLAPYPSQVLYGALAGALLALLTARKRRWTAAGLLLYGLLWLLLYRLQPPLYPYPLRGLPLWTVGTLGALAALKHGPALAARAPWLVRTAAPAAVVVVWTAATLLAAQGHVTLSRPGVESDFRVFATRASLDQVFSADGFYNLGYPLLLWLVRPLFEGNAFLAARLIAALSGAVMLAAGYWLARCLLPPGPALLALTTLALSGLVAQYGLYVGSDMPLAACTALCVAALAASTRGRTTATQRAQSRASVLPTTVEALPDRTASPTAVASLDQGPKAKDQSRATAGRLVFGLQSATRRALLLVALAGLCGGLAFLMRHLGLVLLPWGVLALLLGRAGWRAVGVYSAAFLLAMAPQVAVNLAHAGEPLYNQQAKNVWLAVYGGTDWGRWEEAPNAIGLLEVVLQDPARFLDNWWRNVTAFLGSGAEDTSEFGRALQLRLLNFPANWLAAGALLWWLVQLAHRLATPALRLSPPAPRSLKASEGGLPVASAGSSPAVGARGPEALASRGSGGEATPPYAPPPGHGGERTPQARVRQQSQPVSGRAGPAQLWGWSPLARTERGGESLTAALLLLIALSVALVSTAFTLQRFFLPLAPVYAAAAGWCIWRLAGGGQALLGTGLALVVVLWGGYGAGTRYVLANQPADEVAMVQMVTTATPPEALIAARVAGRLPVAKYSALAHRVVEWPVGGDLERPLTPTDLDEARAAGASYLLWDEATGAPPLDNPAAAQVALAGRYALYRLEE